MSALWFVGFTLAWTAVLAVGAHSLCLGNVKARFAHTIWRGAALLSMLPWVLLGLSQVLPTPSAATIPDMPYLSGTVGALSSSAVTLELSNPPGSAVSVGFLLWSLLLAGWTLRLGQILLSQVRLQSIKRRAKPAGSFTTHEIAMKLGLKQAPGVAFRRGGSPFVAGIRQRTIYLPEGLDDPGAVDIVLAHECTHLARGDLLSRPLERLIADIFWFSPFVWRMREQLDFWREAACDEQTLELTGDRVRYAKALARTARLTRARPAPGLPVTAFIPFRKAPLKRRLHQVLKQEDKLSRGKLAGLACATSILLAPLSLFAIASPTLGDGFSHPLLISSQAHIAASFGNTDYYGKQRWHAGVDIAAPRNACVHAPTNGTVISANFKLDYGNTMDVLLEDGRIMRFANLDHMHVKRGASIEAGDVVGTVGLSAFGVTRPHLHFEMFERGEYVDPLEIEGLVLIAGIPTQGSQTTVYLQP